MRLADYNIEEFKARLGEDRPLIVTQDNARKALMTKLNRSGGLAVVRKKSRLTRRGLMTRGNSFAGYSFGQRVVVKIRYVKHKVKSTQARESGAGVGNGRTAGGGGASSLR